MNIALTIAAIVIWAWLAVIWVRRVKTRREIERLSITPEALHDLLEAHHDVVVVDARQPLDLLVDSEIIPGAQRVAPQDAIDNPGLIPNDRELVVYCTCPSDKTSLSIALKAQSAAPSVNLNKVKFLRGGLSAWKAKGYPTVPYDKTFHLDTGT
jgi:rhodanese-related sulfurtransferase